MVTPAPTATGRRDAVVGGRGGGFGLAAAAAAARAAAAGGVAHGDGGGLEPGRGGGAAGRSVGRNLPPSHGTVHYAKLGGLRVTQESVWVHRARSIAAAIARRRLGPAALKVPRGGTL